MVTKAKKTTGIKKKTPVVAAIKTTARKTTTSTVKVSAKPKVAPKKVVTKAPKVVTKVSLPKVKLKTNTVAQIIFMISIIIFLAFMILKFHEII